MKIKILLSAFACAPGTGSEAGVGWRWAIELAKWHEVTVVTDISRRAQIESLATSAGQQPRIVYFRPSWLRLMPLNSMTAQLLYTLWQFSLLGFVRRLHIQHGFELVIHITYSVFRHPSFLGFLGIPFLFGPLGGGEDCPLRLKRSIRGKEKLRELARAVMNKLALVDPFLWSAFARSTLILASTEQTRRALPWPYRRRAVVYPNLGVDALENICPNGRRLGEALSMIFAGRLLGWKGVHLAIRAVAEARRRGADTDLTIVGRGPYEQELRRVASSTGVVDAIHWRGHLPQRELFEIYRTMHCLLFPSLHDSGGSVVLEAQANGLPVICLDIGGPATLVTAASAVIIPTNRADEATVVDLLASAIERIARDENLRLSMSRAALAHAREQSWTARVAGALKLAQSNGLF